MIAATLDLLTALMVTFTTAWVIAALAAEFTEREAVAWWTFAVVWGVVGARSIVAFGVVG